MWERKGRGVSIAVTPVPSRFTSMTMEVSLVARSSRAFRTWRSHRAEREDAKEAKVWPPEPTAFAVSSPAVTQEAGYTEDEAEFDRASQALVDRFGSLPHRRRQRHRRRRPPRSELSQPLQDHGRRRKRRDRAQLEVSRPASVANIDAAARLSTPILS